MVVARPLISLIYGGGEFDEFSTGITTDALMWMSLGMAGYALQNVLSRVYFARQEGRGPLVAGAVAIGANILLCWCLVGRFQVAGLARGLGGVLLACTPCASLSPWSGGGWGCGGAAWPGTF